MSESTTDCLSAEVPQQIHSCVWGVVKKYDKWVWGSQQDHPWNLLTHASSKLKQSLIDSSSPWFVKNNDAQKWDRRPAGSVRWLGLHVLIIWTCLTAGEFLYLSHCRTTKKKRTTVKTRMMRWVKKTAKTSKDNSEDKRGHCWRQHWEKRGAEETINHKVHPELWSCPMSSAVAVIVS